MTRKEFMKEIKNVINPKNGMEEKMTRAEIVCEAIRINSDDYDRQAKEFSNKALEIRENWEAISESRRAAGAMFATKELSCEEYISTFRPRPIRTIDQISWYSQEALRVYCEAMNYELN